MAAQSLYVTIEKQYGGRSSRQIDFSHYDSSPVLLLLLLLLAFLERRFFETSPFKGAYTRAIKLYDIVYFFRQLRKYK